ncbi:beta-glucosidase [Halolactibacillus halophilus]|uniref:Beta-glucosidase n=1 Tax=Halolactibacillus halophilus TaxID=306540 RepID=A0A1I5QCU5_9BACI|nr:glycoside hydrolase family 3 protein [Halolactibacillus halophilus]GEM01743.1 beta-glucosidase [Halolactibacillus halophilus]SFP43937.1 beta-glucosidase [Halolactibacillus halophilus]
MTQSISNQEHFITLSRQAAAEGAVLIKNDANVLPLKPQTKIAVFGRSQFDFYRSGTGSGGSVNVRYSVNLVDGLTKKNVILNERLKETYEKWLQDHPFDNGGGGWAMEPWFQEEMSITPALVAEAKLESDVAIVVIGRTAGEDKDNLDQPGSYQLTKDEETMLDLVSQTFDQVVVVLNVSNIIDMSWLELSSFGERINSVVYVWQGGMEGGNAASDILVGDETPSGKLTDTIAYRLHDYPAAKNYGGEEKNHYEEDIYVGYRYFETFCPENVLFPFGYGLSYTTFDYTIQSAEIKRNCPSELIEVTVKVTNTGATYSGKEVIQLYMEAPQGQLGKPVYSLIGFNKTKKLAPGETEIITLHVPIEQLASYDEVGLTGEKASFVLEEGEYRFHIGTDVKTIKPVLFNEKSEVFIKHTVIDRLEEAARPVEALMRMKPGEKRGDGTYQLVYEPVPMRTIDLDERINTRLPKEIAAPKTRYTLQDVANAQIDMDTFIGQLTNDQLATIVRGEGMSSPYVTPGTASAFGGVGDDLLHYGVPIACTADGPSGLRMESGVHSTQVPIGTALSATWNIDLIEALYTCEGIEMYDNQVDLLLGPGMNIRRHPLNGRNFEYFSEDPLVTGAFAAAVTKGIKKAGVEATLKHFACNNQEKHRHNVDAVVSERALREIYLKGFEMAVKDGQARAVMTAYNPINGHWAASHYDLVTTILRREWGFNGIVMTDWWAKMNDCVTGGEAKTTQTNHMVRSGNDVYMVVNNYGADINSAGDNTLQSLEDNTLTRAELQQAAKRIIQLLMTLPVFKRKQTITEQAVIVTPQEHESIGAKSLDLPLDFQTTNEQRIQVEAPGEYRIIVTLMSPQSNLAQSACRLMINNQYVTTIQTNGTDSHVIKQKLVKVALDKGTYSITLQDKGEMLHIHTLQFQRLNQ